MTKGQLIKLLQESPFGDDATITISHCYDFGIVLDENTQLEIQGVTVFDENELTIDIIPDNYAATVVTFKKLNKLFK